METTATKKEKSNQVEPSRGRRWEQEMSTDMKKVCEMKISDFHLLPFPPFRKIDYEKFLRASVLFRCDNFAWNYKSLMSKPFSDLTHYPEDV